MQTEASPEGAAFYQKHEMKIVGEWEVTTSEQQIEDQSNSDCELVKLIVLKLDAWSYGRVQCKFVMFAVEPTSFKCPYIKYEAILV